MKWLNWRQWALKARLWQGLTALWFLVRDARTPRASKAVAWLVLAYALSPIDLIPDFIPVLGLLDDLLLLPLGLMLVVRLAPSWLWQEMLSRARAFEGRLPRMLGGLMLVLLVWALALGALAWWLLATVWAAW